jgi:general secretion pathway protein G
MNGTPGDEEFDTNDSHRLSGFTLIELLIVIAVLGIIAAVVIFALSGTNASAAVAACNADAKTVQTAVAAFTAQNGSVPTQQSQLVGPYLRSWPASSYYTITLSSTGDVLVTAPASGSPVSYSTTACNGAGSPRAARPPLLQAEPRRRRSRPRRRPPPLPQTG